MNNWKTVSLGDVCAIKHGYAFKGEDFSDSPTRYILTTPGNFKIGGGFKCDKPKYYNGEIPTGYVLQKDDVIVTMTDLSKAGDTLGYSALVPNDSDIIYLHNQRVGLVDIISDCVDKMFLYWLLRTRNYQQYIVGSASGSTVKHTSPKSIQNYTFLLPPLEEQQRIARILGALDDKIECNNRINRNLEEQAAVLFRRWFVDFEFPDSDGNPYRSFSGEMIDSPLGKIPKEWKVGKLEDFIDFFNGYAFKSSELIDTQPAADYLDVFKMGHIKKGGGFNMEGTKSWINKLQSKGLERYILQKGDLLMCMTDMKSNVALLGHTALMSVDGKYIVNQRVGLLKSKNRIGIDYPYLYILTNSDDFITDLRSRANSGVQVNLSTSEIKLSKVVIAPNNINICFDNIAKPLFEKVFILEDENRTLAELRDTLLTKLMNNEIKTICQ